MKTTAKLKQDRQTRGGEETQRLIDAATKQPGVAELLAVYQTWQKLDQVSQVLNQFSASRQVISTSSSSAPVVCEPV